MGSAMQCRRPCACMQPCLFPSSSQRRGSLFHCAGLMCVWRAFYAIYLDLSSFRGVAAARRDRGKDMQHFADSLKSAMLLSLAFCAVLQVRGGGVGLAHLSPGWVAWGECGTAGAAGRMCANTELVLGGATSHTTHTLLALPLLPPCVFCSAWAAW